MNPTLDEFKVIISIFPQDLSKIEENKFNWKPEINQWSKKEILGHLIDSAITNYLRFLKAQFQDNPTFLYQQDEYCKFAYYNKSETQQLIDLWTLMNKQLLFLFEQIVINNQLEKMCNNETLAFLMKDYVSHLIHHKNQILIE